MRDFNYIYSNLIAFLFHMTYTNLGNVVYYIIYNIYLFNVYIYIYI